MLRLSIVSLPCQQRFAMVWCVFSYTRVHKVQGAAMSKVQTDAFPLLKIMKRVPLQKQVKSFHLHYHSMTFLLLFNKQTRLGIAAWCMSETSKTLSLFLAFVTLNTSIGSLAYLIVELYLSKQQVWKRSSSNGVPRGIIWKFFFVTFLNEIQAARGAAIFILRGSSAT